MEDVIVIGAGQAGLAVARAHVQQEDSVVVLEAHARVGDSWRHRWAGLRLFTPARYSALPGLAFPADPYHLPDRLEMADYLEAYAAEMGLRVETGAEVAHVSKQVGGGGEFEIATTDHRVFRARRLVIASGAYRTPRLPSFAERLPAELPAAHSSAIRSVRDWPGGHVDHVLVVGAGASGGQLAALLSQKHTVTLAGRNPGALPRSVLGRDVYDYLYGLGVLKLGVRGALGRRLAGTSGGDITVGEDVDALAARHGIARCGRIVDYRAGAFVTEGGASLAGIGAVVFATGFRNRYDFVDIAGALDVDGRPISEGGVSPVGGLFWMGLPKMRRLSSGLIGGVGADAAFVATQ